MKRREFLKGVLFGAGCLCFSGKMATQQAIGETLAFAPATESLKPARKLVYRYVWNENKDCYVLTLVGYCRDTDDLRSFKTQTPRLS